MTTRDDLADVTDLTRAEIAAIQEHEHSDDLDASLMGDYLMHSHHGPQRVQQMICDDIRSALHRGDAAHASALFATLQSFIADHPDAVRRDD